MNDPPAICVDRVSKKFRVSAAGASYGRFSEVLTSLPRRLLGRTTAMTEADTFWALRDVSFDVPHGGAVGLIGHNGAGKSTLLKVISRITRPTSGRVGVAGRVGSLLEVGTGFHPELTGRENTFVNGAVLGMSRREVQAKLDEIVAFAEVERFLDTPVKRYSSGMKMRLAFAVAAHLDPEVLLVDEVLAVGDAAFQKKCLGKMGDVAGSGRTIIFVSHNMLAVRKLCDRAVWLSGGEVQQDGPADEVVAAYSASFETEATECRWDDPPGDDRFQLLSLSVEPTRSDRLMVNRPFRVSAEYHADGDNYLLGVLISSIDQVPISFLRPPVGQNLPSGRRRASFEFPANLLTDGRYTLGVTLFRNETNILDRVENVLTFEIFEDPELRGTAFGRSTGFLRPDIEWCFESCR